MIRAKDELREVRFTKDYTKYADGSVLVEFGNTKVLCTAKIEEKVPFFLRNSGKGWISAEYSMLPNATHERKVRDSVRGKIDGRTHEIQRLIGRALRSVVDLSKIGERTIWIDCDVLQADGGTRTTSITGAFVALAIACDKLYKNGTIKRFPINTLVSAISVGIVENDFILDLEYSQDANATVDMNVVMTEKGEFIEIQSTGEKSPFSLNDFNELLILAQKGCKNIIDLQKNILGDEIVKLILQNENKENIIKKEKEEYDNTKYLNESGKIEFVLASSNEHKVAEFQRILENEEIQLLSLKDVGLDNVEIEENGVTFEENAMIKAKKICELTGKIAIADDSGLCVDYLNGEPGVYSARYSGENANSENNNILLKQKLLGTKFEERIARFVSVIAICFPDNREGYYKGICEGNISFNEIGENGFGYDPLFIPKGFDKTFAQMTAEEKDKISHRARALKNFSRKLKEIL